MTERPPLVLVLSGRRTVEKAKAAGFRVGLVSESLPWDLTLLVDAPLQVSFDDWADVTAQVLRLHERQPVAAVVTQLERLLPLAGQLRDALGLHTGITEQAALNCEDKATTSALLAGNGVGVARSRVVADPEEATDAVAELGGRVVVKPRDAASAAGLMFCDGPTAAAAAVTSILADGRRSALIEEFLPGDEIAIFAYRSAGHTEIVSVLDAEVGPPPKFVKLGGRHPSRHAAGRSEELTALTDRALAAVGLDNWVATVQVMLTPAGPRVIEINPRVPGGQTVDLIAATTGREPTLVAVEAALGREPSSGPVLAKVGRYQGIVFEAAGVVTYRPGVEDDLPPLESGVPPVIDLDVAPGEEVLPLNHPRGGVFGRLIVCGDDEEQVGRDIDQLMSALGIRLDQHSEGAEDAAWRTQSRCC
jgi:predicted ATP-grasp superfamily ATP-dependent carboligase